MLAFASELRAASRSLRRSPKFVALVLLVLASGVGCSTAAFSLLNAAFFTPPPFADVERLVVVEGTTRLEPETRSGMSGPDYFDLKRQNDSFEGLAATSVEPVTLTGSGILPQRIEHATMSHEMLALLGWRPLLGRWFNEEEDRPGAQPVAVIGEGLWRRLFGASPRLAGRQIVLDGLPHTVVGVLPADFEFPDAKIEAWRPLAAGPETFHRRARFLLTVGRLRPGISLIQAQEEVKLLGRHLAAEYPQTNSGRGLDVVLLQHQANRDSQLALWALNASMLVLLLIGCSNVASLLLARGLAQTQDIAIRGALGAGPHSLFKLGIYEAALLTLPSVLAGSGVAVFLLWGFSRLGSAAFPALKVPATLNVFMLGFAVGLAVLITLAAGALPGLQASRIELATALRSQGRSSIAHSSMKWQQLLIVLQISLAFALLITGTLLMQSFVNLAKLDLGFDPKKLLRIAIQLPDSRYPTDMKSYPAWPEVLSFYEQLRGRVETLPGIRSLTLSAEHPLQPGWSVPLSIAGSALPDEDRINLRAVYTGYFETAGLRLLQGRTFSAGDRVDARRVAILSDSLMRRYFPERSPLGAKLEIFNATREVVGVVSDVRAQGLDRRFTAEAVYVPLNQAPSEGFSLLVRTSSQPLPLVKAIRREVAAIDPELAIYEAETMEQVVAGSLTRPRFNAFVIGTFGLMALVLAAVGLSATLLQLVRRRRKEIGVRVALGARPMDILLLVFSQAMTLVATGIAAGSLIAFWAARLIQNLLFGIEIHNPWTFVFGGFLLGVVTILASAFPAVTAARQDPVQILRAS